MTPFDASWKEAFSKQCGGKGENAGVTSISSFSPTVFYSITDKDYPLCYIYFVVCICLQFGQGQFFCQLGMC